MSEPPYVEHVALPARTAAERAADEVIGRLQASGHEAFRVGGCVRDRLLGRCVADVDVATSATPTEVKGTFPRTIGVGASFGVTIVHIRRGLDIEVATFRQESDYRDGRRPGTVRYGDLVADAGRRDFSINALYYDPVCGKLMDFAGGLADMGRGVIRCIGNPAQRFAEDHLRLLRAVRFAAEMSFRLAPDTRQAVAEQAASLGRISAERVFAELDKMLLGRRPHVAFAQLADLGLLEVCLPEVSACRDVPQPPEFHPEGDVWQHTLLLLRHLRGASSVLAWSALLHDVGKPVVHELRDGRDRFSRHASVGRDLCGSICRRLHTPKSFARDVSAIVGNHMAFMDVRSMRTAKLRRLLGRATFRDELELHRLDCISSHGKLGKYCFLLDEMWRLASEPPVPPPLLRGTDVLELGIPSGPVVGQLLLEAQERQLGGELADRAAALAWLRQRAEATGKVSAGEGRGGE